MSWILRGGLQVWHASRAYRIPLKEHRPRIPSWSSFLAFLKLAASPRKEFIHSSGAPIFAAASQIAWLWRPAELTLVFP